MKLLFGIRLQYKYSNKLRFICKKMVNMLTNIKFNDTINASAFECMQEFIFKALSLILSNFLT